MQHNYRSISVGLITSIEVFNSFKILLFNCLRQVYTSIEIFYIKAHNTLIFSNFG